MLSFCFSGFEDLHQPRPLASHTMNNQPTNTVWMRLRTPALFGAGLYLGLMLFGRESKQGSEYFEGLRGMFEVRAPRSGGRVDTDNGAVGGRVEFTTPFLQDMHTRVYY